MSRHSVIHIGFGALLLSLLCSCSSRPSDSSSFPLTDSVSRAMTEWLVKEDFARALEIVDSADASGWLSEVDAEMMRLRVISREEGRLSEAKNRYVALLERSLTVNQELNVLQALVKLSRQERNDEDQLEYGTRYMEASRKAGHETQSLATQAEMGSTLIRLGRTEEGLEMIDQAIRQLDGVRKFTEMDACILALKSKIRTLIDLNRYEEIIPLGEQMVAKMQDYAAHPDEYADGSFREPNEARRPGYVDFYTGQAYAFITYAYASMGQLEKARVYSRLFDATDYGRTYGGRKMMATSWSLMGEYDKMDAIYDEMVAAMGADTVNYDYGVMLYNRASVAQKKGHWAQSADLWKRYASLQSRLNDAQRLAAAEESAARFHEQEQQHALAQEKARHKRDQLIQIALSVMAVLISIVAFLIFYQLRLTRRKNALLTKEIAENIDYKMRYLTQKSHPQLTVETKDEESAPHPSMMSNAELFEFLRVVIVSEQLFLNPYFERKNLTDRFGLSKDRIGAAFSQGSPYASLTDYVNECRLSYSTNLLATRPDMSIADVASASGFSNASVFTRNFKQRYTMTPTEFRKKEN